jgi:hypothetical protein
VNEELRKMIARVQAIVEHRSGEAMIDPSSTLGILENLSDGDGKVQAAIGLVLKAIRDSYVPGDGGG